MTNKLMHISNDDTQNCPFCRLQLEVETFRHSTNELTNHNSIKIPNVIKPTKDNESQGKRYYKALGTAQCPPSLLYTSDNEHYSVAFL